MPALADQTRASAGLVPRGSLTTAHNKTGRLSQRLRSCGQLAYQSPSTVPWEPTEDFLNSGYQDVIELVERWRQQYGADHHACGMMLRTMGLSYLEHYGEGGDHSSTHPFPNHAGSNPPKP